MSSPKGNSNSNSNKTAHVMNLLRKSNPTPPPADDVEEDVAPASPVETPVAASAAPASPTVPAPTASPAPTAPSVAPSAPIITALNADTEISSQIRDALEQELLEASTPPTPEVEVKPAPIPQPEPPAIPKAPEPQLTPPAPAPEPTAPASGAGKLSQDEIEKMLAGFAADTEPAPQPTPPAPAPEPTAPASGAGKLSQDEIEKMLAGFAADTEPAPPAPTPEPPAPAAPLPEPEEDFQFFNIMQRLIEEKADHYISMFGLCNCKRCRCDVIALALNGLAPKYVVMPPSEMTVRSDMYASRHNSEVTAQLLQACREVMDHPRHEKK